MNMVERRRKSTKAAAGKDFAGAFAALKQILQQHENHMQVLADKPKNYCLAMKTVFHRGKPLWFAAVQSKKNYVSFHLLPVYMNPALQKQISPELKKRMQGKACFNFTAPDEKLFAELRKLTATGLQHFRTFKSSPYLPGGR